jgi:pimeloyl-ACP methyl ester carboxylesterase
MAAYPPTGQFVTVDGLRLHYEMAGSGPDLVMIHGASGSLRDLTFALRDQLTDRFRVIVVDRPGLGHSDPLPDTSLLAQARAIKAGVAQLGVTDPVVLGQSYGGAVALAWALDGGPRALVLVGSPSMPWPGKLDPWYRLTSTAVGRALVIPLASAFVPQSYVSAATTAVFAPDPVPPGYEAHLGTAMALRRPSLAVNTAQINALRAELVTMEPRYPTLTLPVELIHGTADTIVPLTIHSGPLSQLLPNVRLTTIDGAGHMPHHSHSAAVIAAIDRAALR